MTSTTVFVGIDIARADVVVACRPDGTSWTATNDLEGITAAVDRVRGLAPSLIVLEATGGYEIPLVVALAASGLPVVVANPRQVRDFAKATGQLAKTDRLDAYLLALLGERVHPAPRPLPDAALRRDDVPPVPRPRVDSRGRRKTGLGRWPKPDVLFPSSFPKRTDQVSNK